MAGVRAGDVLAGKYRVERVLGRGGMGVVVAAHHLQLDERVALKFLLPEALESPEAAARFVREARAAVKIKSEHVARVSDVGTLPSGAPYMVMEYLEGGDLAAWLKQRGPLPIEQAVEFVLQACVAVADAHALGIVHRDLKPANLFCVRRSDGQLSIKVLDFGISKLTDPSGMDPGSATRTSALMGSPLYMSPEQMRSSRDVDARTDLWALGVILFELMGGRAPFKADTVTELAIQVASEPTPPIRSLRPEVPAGLEAVIFRCLQKNRQDRYRNVAELALALLPYAPKRAKASVERISGIVQAAGLSASALQVPPSPQPPVETMIAPETVSPVGRTARPMPRKRAVVSLIGIAGAGLAIGIAAWGIRRPAVAVPTPVSGVQGALSVDPAAAAPDLRFAAPRPADRAGEAAAPAAAPAAGPVAESSVSARANAPAPPVRPVAPAHGAAPKSAVQAPVPPAPKCRLVSSFDKDGNEHFQQVCK